MSQAAYDLDHPVVTVTATIMDGTVVRWFASLDAAIHQRPALSAGRRGVAVHAEYLTDVPDAWVASAREVHRILDRHDGTDLTHMATHRRRGLGGPLEEVQRG